MPILIYSIKVFLTIRLLFEYWLCIDVFTKDYGKQLLSQNFFPNTIEQNVFSRILKSNHHERCPR